MDRFLTTGIDPERPLHTTALRLTDEEEVDAATGIGAVGPYDDGGFIVLGKPDTSLCEGGVQTVIVNEHFYEALPLLQEKFPQAVFIRADELPEKLSRILEEHEASLTNERK